MKKTLLTLISLCSLNAFAVNSYVVEAARPLSPTEIATLSKKMQGKLTRFSPGSHSAYFSRLYSLDSALAKQDFEQNSLVRKIEPVHLNKLEAYGVIPMQSGTPLTNDPLIGYQWALNNHGQIVTRDVDDITTAQRQGVAGYDIGIKNVQKMKLPRNPVVAIIDYGVDVNHPDIKDNIYQNTAECDNGEIPVRPTKDLDNNGYMGDCKGWNFTGPDKAGSNHVIDEAGHGTHVAGIIAAIGNNDIGVTGVHSQIKILPLQVLTKATSSNELGSRSDWVAKAIIYATQMKVDVINMSLGWPLFLDQQYLRQAVKEALDAGIVIVAAAGNNNHSAPIFPCAYEGVICVGAINNDGTVAGFSNYGGHVDLLAPGDNILSLLPMDMQADFFSLQGYEIKSGTSQAAPFVSAAAAILKSLDPHANGRTVLSKMLTSSKPIADKVKYFSGGLLQVSDAISSTKGLVRPILKEINLAAVDFRAKTFTYTLKMENLSAQAQNVNVRVTSGNPNVRFSQGTVSLSLAAWQIVSTMLTGTFDGDEKSNLVPLSIQVASNLGNKTYLHQIDLARNLVGDPGIQKFALPGAVGTGLKTVSSRWLKNPTQKYYFQKITDAGLTVNMLELADNQMKAIGSAMLPNVQQILTFVQTDINYDGIVDYEIQAVEVKGTEKAIKFFHFDQHMQPLFGANSVWDFKVESVLMPGVSVEPMRIQDKVLGTIAVPVFFGQGIIPDADQDVKAFQTKDATVATRLYYLMPTTVNGKITLQTRVMDSPQNLKAWGQGLKLSYQQDVHLLSSLDGQTLLASAGEEFQRKSYFIQYAYANGRINFKLLPLQSPVVLDGFLADVISDLSFPDDSKYMMIGQYDGRWDLFALNTNSATPTMQIRPKDVTEPLQVYIKTFKDASTLYTFVQTPSEILLQRLSSRGQQQWVYPFHVSTFISNDMYSDHTYPVVTKMQGQNAPALLVDSSQITAQHIYLLSFANEELVVPIKTSLQIPDACLSMNPIPATKTSSGKFAFLCQKSQVSSELWLLPME